MYSTSSTSIEKNRSLSIPPADKECQKILNACVKIVEITHVIENSDKNLPKIASKVREFFGNHFPKHPKDFCIYQYPQGQLILNYGTGWETYTMALGSFMRVFIGEKRVIKTPGDTNATSITDYLVERRQLENIYKQIGNSNIGIQPPREQPTPLPTLTTLIRGWEQTLKAYHIEDPYKGTIADLPTLPLQRFSSICACLVQGSKIFLEKDIIPLDVKSQNIGYRDNGHAEHFDFSDPLSIHQPNDTLTYGKNGPQNERSTIHILTSQIFPRVEENTELTLSNTILGETLSGEEGPLSLRKKQKELLSISGKRLHIWELGTAFKELSKKTTNLPPEQESMITRMCSPSPENRPAIEEVETVFPKTLILPKK